MFVFCVILCVMLSDLHLNVCCACWRVRICALNVLACCVCELLCGVVWCAEVVCLCVSVCVF